MILTRILEATLPCLHTSLVLHVDVQRDVFLVLEEFLADGAHVENTCRVQGVGRGILRRLHVLVFELGLDGVQDAWNLRW